MIEYVGLVVGGRRIEITFEEAKKLYQDLANLFEPRVYTYPPYPNHPITITSGSTCQSV